MHAEFYLRITPCKSLRYHITYAPCEETADNRLYIIADFHLLKSMVYFIKRLHVHPAEESTRETEYGITDQLDRISEDKIRRIKQRIPAEKKLQKKQNKL